MAKEEKPTTATPSGAPPPETPWNRRQWLDAALDTQRRGMIVARLIERYRQELEHDFGLRITIPGVEWSLDAATAATYGPLDRIFVRRLYPDVLHQMRPELVSPAEDETDFRALGHRRRWSPASGRRGSKRCKLPWTR